jgi:DnaJ-class molecular chaperone
MAETDYYKILGVSRGASQDEIKRAFRKKAHELHPDKGGDAEAFKRLNEAYQVLSDPEKRQRYDTFGAAGVGNGSTAGGYPGGFDFDMGGFGFNFGGGLGDIFSDMFSAAMANVQAEVQISVPQAVLGDTVELRVGEERVKLTIPPGTQDGQQVVLRGKGRSHRGGRGDLVIVFRVSIPRRLSRRERELYEQLRQESR